MPRGITWEQATQSFSDPGKKREPFLGKTIFNAGTHPPPQKKKGQRKGATEPLRQNKTPKALRARAPAQPRGAWDPRSPAAPRWPAPASSRPPGTFGRVADVKIRRPGFFSYWHPFKRPIKEGYQEGPPLDFFYRDANRKNPGHVDFKNSTQGGRMPRDAWV